MSLVVLLYIIWAIHVKTQRDLKERGCGHGCWKVGSPSSQVAVSNPGTYLLRLSRAAARCLESNRQEEFSSLAICCLRICICPTWEQVTEHKGDTQGTLGATTSMLTELESLRQSPVGYTVSEAAIAMPPPNASGYSLSTTREPHCGFVFVINLSEHSWNSRVCGFTMSLLIQSRCLDSKRSQFSSK